MAFKFYFEFITTGFGMVECQEPIGSDAVSHTVEQEDGRFGRDVSYSGNADAKYKITHKDNPHLFELFRLEYEMFGHQAEIRYFVEYSDILTVVGQVDMQTFSTDTIENAEFSVIPISEISRFKERMDVDVNVFAIENLDGNPITPVATHKMLLPAKPIFQRSTWENSIAPGAEILPYGNQFAPGFFNTIKNITVAGIDGSNSWLYSTAYASFSPIDYDFGKPQDFRVINAKDNLSNLKANFRLHMSTEWTDINNPTNAGMQVVGLFLKGKTEDTQTDFFNRLNAFLAAPTTEEGVVFYNSGLLGPQTGNYEYEIDSTLIFPLPSLDRSDTLYFMFIHISPDVDALSRNRIFESKLDITATATAYNTVIQVARYRDVIQYTTNAISGMDTVLPEFDPGQEFYNQFISSGYLMRNITDKPFNINAKEIIEDQIQPEICGDYQVNPDRTVYFATYPNFYRPVRIGSFLQKAIEGYNVTNNKRFANNKLQVGFSNYASLKENDTDNTLQIVHGEGQWFIPNNSTSGTREINVGFIRDAFYIAEQQKKSYDLSDTAGTQDDDKKFMFDVVELAPGRQYTETSLLQHQSGEGVLILRNDSSFSFAQLGIAIGSQFTILTGDNAGTYLVQMVEPTAITLSGSGDDILEENTSYRYFISNDVQLVARTNEGFGVIENIDDGNNYINLLYTTARVMRRHSEVVSTDRFYTNKPVKNTSYTSNADAATQFGDGDYIVEGSDWSPSNSILTPNLISASLRISYAEYVELVRRLWQDRGYIEFNDPYGFIRQGYIQKIEFTPVRNAVADIDEYEGLADFVLEERYNQLLLRVDAGEGYFIINGNSQPSAFYFDIDMYGRVRIYNEDGLQITNAILYDRISINDLSYSSSTALGEALAIWLVQY